MVSRDIKRYGIFDDFNRRRGARGRNQSLYDGGAGLVGDMHDAAMAVRGFKPQSQLP